MKKQIILSIIITNFNKAKYLIECLNSITKQNLYKVEVILIDDNSSDQSKKILKKYKDKIQIIYNKKNLGPSACRNKGIKKANGLYTVFVDADDKICASLNKIKKNILLQKSNSDLILMKYLSTSSDLNNYNFFINEKKIYKKYPTDLFLKKKINLLNQHESVWYILFRNNFLKKNKILFLKKSNCLEDLDFVVRSILLSNNISLLNIKYYFYRELAESLKKNFSIDRTRGALNVYRSLKSFNKKKLTSIKKKFLNLRIMFAKNIFFMRYYLLTKKKNFVINKNINKFAYEIKKNIVKNFSIKKNDKIAIYCYGPSGKFLFKMLNEMGLREVIFLDDRLDLVSTIPRTHKIYKLNKEIAENYKIIIANPKRFIVSNIKNKNKKVKMLNFNINDFPMKRDSNSNSF